MTASSCFGASSADGSAATAVALGVSDSVPLASGCAGAGGGDAGAGAVSAMDAEVAAMDDASVAEPGEETGTSATTAVRSMRPRLTLSSGDRNREPSQRKM